MGGKAAAKTPKGAGKGGSRKKKSGKKKVPRK